MFSERNALHLSQTEAALLTLAIFITSLQSFYISSLGGPIIPYIGGALLVALAVATAIRRSKSAIVPAAGLCASVVFVGVAVLGTSATGSYKAASGVMFGCALFLATTSFLRNRPDYLARALGIVIAIHLALLAIQMCWYYLTGEYLDYLHFTDDHAVWNSSKGWQVAGQLIPRFTGAFNEPGTYSGVMGILVATYYFMRRKANATVWVAIASMVASASSTGAILAVALAAAIGWDYIKGLTGLSKISAITLAVVMIAVAIVLISARFSDRLQYTGGSEDVAFLNLGWLTDVSNVTPLGHSINSLPDYVSVEYFGIWMTTYIHFGFAGLLALLALLSPAFFANPAIFGALLLAKGKITFPLIYILAAGIWVSRSRKLKS